MPGYVFFSLHVGNPIGTGSVHSHRLPPSFSPRADPTQSRREGLVPRVAGLALDGAPKCPGPQLGCSRVLPTHTPCCRQGHTFFSGHLLCANLRPSSRMKGTQSLGEGGAVRSHDRVGEGVLRDGETSPPSVLEQGGRGEGAGRGLWAAVRVRWELPLGQMRSLSSSPSLTLLLPFFSPSPSVCLSLQDPQVPWGEAGEAQGSSRQQERSLWSIDLQPHTGPRDAAPPTARPQVPRKSPARPPSCAPLAPGPQPLPALSVI